MGLQADQVGLQVDQIGLQVGQIGLRVDQIGLQADQIGLQSWLHSLGAQGCRLGAHGRKLSAQGRQPVRACASRDAASGSIVEDAAMRKAFHWSVAMLKALDHALREALIHDGRTSSSVTGVSGMIWMPKV